MFTQQDIDLAAKHAVENFLTHGTELSNSVAKTAEDRELNPNQIARIVEAVNHKANHAMRETAEDMRFTFKLASGHEVRDIIHGTGADSLAYKKATDITFDRASITKTAAAAASEPEYYFAAGDAYNDPVARMHMFKTALRSVVSRASLYSADEDAAVKYAEIQIMQAKERLAPVLRDFVCEQQLDKVATAIAARYDGDTAELLLQHVYDVVKPMSERMHFKEANEANLAALRMPAGDETVPNVPRINGNHPMIVELDTIKSQEYDRNRRRVHRNMHREVSNAGVKALHTLNNNETVHKYVVDRIMRFQDRYKKAPKIAMDCTAIQFAEVAPALLDAMTDAQVARISYFLEKEGMHEGFACGVLDAQEDPVFAEKCIAVLDKHAQGYEALFEGLQDSMGQESLPAAGGKMFGMTVALKSLVDLLSKGAVDRKTGEAHLPFQTAELSHKGVARRPGMTASFAIPH